MVALPSGELLVVVVVVVNGNGRLEANFHFYSPLRSALQHPAEGISGVIDSQNLLEEA